MNKLEYKFFFRKVGIYKITNQINGKFYIGSSVNLYNRNRSHYSKLFTNKHPNSKLQNSANKYGLKNFTFEIITECNVEELLILEGRYIESLKPEYNIDKIDLNGKRTCDIQTKKLIGQKSKQKFIDNPELTQKFLNSIGNIAGWNKGLTGIYSKDTLEKMSKAGKKNIQNRPKEIQDKFYEGRNQSHTRNRKKIIQYDLNMNFIKEWNSLSDAANAMGAKSLGNFTTAYKKGIKLFESYWRLKE